MQSKTTHSPYETVSGPEPWRCLPKWSVLNLQSRIVGGKNKSVSLLRGVQALSDVKGL